MVAVIHDVKEMPEMTAGGAILVLGSHWTESVFLRCSLAMALAIITRGFFYLSTEQENTSMTMDRTVL